MPRPHAQHVPKVLSLLGCPPAGDTFYVIEEGTFTVFDDTRGELARISKGSCFGELALLRQDARAASVRTLTDALVLACHRDDFIQKLGSLADIRHMWRFEALRKVGPHAGVARQMGMWWATFGRPCARVDLRDASHASRRLS